MTIEELNTWCKEQRVYKGYGDLYLIKPIDCADGFSFSVAASEFHDSLPRNCIGPWTHFHVGFPTSEPEIIDMAGQELKSYVPAHMIVQEIEAHGGAV